MERLKRRIVTAALHMQCVVVIEVPQVHYFLQQLNNFCNVSELVITSTCPSPRCTDNSGVWNCCGGRYISLCLEGFTFINETNPLSGPMRFLVTRGLMTLAAQGSIANRNLCFDKMFYLIAHKRDED